MRKAQRKDLEDGLGQLKRMAEAKKAKSDNEQTESAQAEKKIKQAKEAKVSLAETGTLPFKKLGGQIANVTKDTVKLSVGKFRRGAKALNKWVSISGPTPNSIIPDTLVILVQVVEEDPRMTAWVQSLSQCNLPTRIAQLKGLSAGMRSDRSGAELADAFDKLQDPRVFEAFLKILKANR
ncbi:MAG: hypothetical protein AAGA18_11770 [Verrucomicrobiota bacterium]